MNKPLVNLVLGGVCLLLLAGALVLWKSRTGDMRSSERRRPVEVEQSPQLIRYATWQEETRVLTVYFESRPRMDFKNVPAEVWQAMDSAESTDAFFLEHIEGKYAY